jgi:hypothetical protein
MGLPEYYIGVATESAFRDALVEHGFCLLPWEPTEGQPLSEALSREEIGERGTNQNVGGDHKSRESYIFLCNRDRVSLTVLVRYVGDMCEFTFLGHDGERKQVSRAKDEFLRLFYDLGGRKGRD